MSQNVNKLMGHSLRKFKKKKKKMRTNIHTTEILNFYITSMPHAIVHERERVRESVKGGFIRRLLIT